MSIPFLPSKSVFSRLNVRWMPPFFIVLMSIVLWLNVTELWKKTANMWQIRAKIPYIFMGFKFSGLEGTLKDEEYIGYYTDKDMDNRRDALQFAQAQYVLAPVVLDLNNTEHQYVLFDFTDEAAAMQKIREMRIIPLRKNQFGIILALNPQFAKP